jgi:hypothetical protein
VLRAWGASEQAEVLERIATEIESAWSAYWMEQLTVAEAAVESGYSPDYLRELVRDGSIPDRRPPGDCGRIRIQRRHLPRKCGPVDDEGIDEFTERLLGARSQ